MNGLVDTRSDLRFASLQSPRPIGLNSKRVIDVVLALSAIVLLHPLLIICFVVTVLRPPDPRCFVTNGLGSRGNVSNA